MKHKTLFISIGIYIPIAIAVLNCFLNIDLT